MLSTRFVIVVLVCFGHQGTLADKCDPRLPHCRNGLAQSDEGRRPECKPFWLIPGRADDCTKPTAEKLLKIDAQSVVITPSPVKLPGCFTISMKVDILAGGMDIPKSYLSKIEYSWLNFPQFATLACQNTSRDGCGGFGNNCYYCDICNSLQELDSNGKVKSNQIARQFKDVECPTKPGSYRLQREFCFNDFSEFDKNRNCQPDFLENDTPGAANYQNAIKNVEKLGFGTVTAKFTLAHNSTKEQQQRKTTKEAEIEQSVDTDLTEQRMENGWAMDDSQYRTFRQWYVQFRKDKWHKQDYLPWVLYKNEIGCLAVNFEVCNKPPTPMARGSVTMMCL